jgi:hypothetical protein
VVEKYYNFFPTFTDVKILGKFTMIKVVFFSSIFLGKKPPFVVDTTKGGFFTLQPYLLIFVHYPLRGELFPPIGSHSESCDRTHHM